MSDKTIKKYFIQFLKKHKAYENFSKEYIKKKNMHPNVNLVDDVLKKFGGDYLIDALMPVTQQYTVNFVPNYWDKLSDAWKLYIHVIEVSQIVQPTNNVIRYNIKHNYKFVTVVS